MLRQIGLFIQFRLFGRKRFFMSCRISARGAAVFATGTLFTCNSPVCSSCYKKNSTCKQYVNKYGLHVYSAPNFFLRDAVVVEPGRSKGNPNTLSHNKEASTPKALETPKSTV